MHLAILLATALALWLALRALAPATPPPRPAAATLAAPPPCETNTPVAATLRAATEHGATTATTTAASAWRRFTVAIADAPADTQEVPVELLFAPEPAAAMRLLVAPDHPAVIDLAPPTTTPLWVDFVWPIGPSSAQFVGRGAASATLRWPTCGSLVVELVDAEGRPATADVDARVRLATAVWPHGRWRLLPGHGGTIHVPVELGTGTVEVRLQHGAREPMLLVVPAPTEPGEVVRRRMVLRAD